MCAAELVYCMVVGPQELKLAYWIPVPFEACMRSLPFFWVSIDVPSFCSELGGTKLASQVSTYAMNRSRRSLKRGTGRKRCASD